VIPANSRSEEGSTSEKKLRSYSSLGKHWIGQRRISTSSLQNRNLECWLHFLLMEARSPVSVFSGEQKYRCLINGLRVGGENLSEECGIFRTAHDRLPP
jgi:hypothetical protein